MSDPVIETLPAVDSSLPAWIAGIPSALVPSSLKALDRLLGAVVDYPVALIKRETAKIDAQTKAFEIVELAIAKSAGESAGTDVETVGRALKVLVRKTYRKQSNREAVAAEAVSELKTDPPVGTEAPNPTEPPNEDWLNVFERFAEDASTERMQGLWGRVLAGEIRRPGRFSLRTLRFLSEFSQSDAELFAELSQYAVGQLLLKALVKPEGQKDIRHLMQLEAAGLISDASGLGLTLTTTFDATGHVFIAEENLRLVFRGEPNTSVILSCLSLTPLGVEVMSLIPNRDTRSAMRAVAQAARSSQITAAFIGHQANPSHVNLIEELWLDEPLG
jgi:hypothetical protein